MAKNPESSKMRKLPSVLFNFPLQITPEKLVIPSSGHLDVQITNPMSEPFQVDFQLYSFYCDVERAWYLKDGKEVDVNISWEEFSDVKVEDIREFDIISNSKIFSHVLNSDDVFHVRIKCEEKFDGIKKKFTYSEPDGYLHIECEVKIDHVVRNQKKIQLKPKFHLRANSYIPLSIDPKCEMAKELAEKFSKQHKHQVRRQRIKASRFEKEQKEIAEGYWEYESEELHAMNVEILTKYGSKIDKLSDDEITKIKVDYEEEQWRKTKEENEKHRLENNKEQEKKLGEKLKKEQEKRLEEEKKENEAQRQKEQQDQQEAAEDAKREEVLKKQTEEKSKVIGMKKKKKTKKCVLM
uniref:MSP domain-containing protein n=1 Tax=Caenorhabditis tropicalis TaxID=1561998 RepID=A0A1I7UPI2_9PELO